MIQELDLLKGGVIILAFLTVIIIHMRRSRQRNKDMMSWIEKKNKMDLHLLKLETDYANQDKGVTDGN